MKVTFWIPLTSVAFASEGFISGSGFGTGFSSGEGFPEASGAPLPRTIGISMECRDYENWQAPTWESGFTVTCDSMEEMGWWCSGGDVLAPRDEFFPGTIVGEEGTSYAWEACCICGGGMHETPEPTSEPEPASKCDGLVGPRCRNREGCIWKNKKRQCLEAAQVCPELKGHSCRKRKGCEWKNRECVPEATGNDVCPAQCTSAFLAAGGCEAMRGHGDFEAVLRDVPEECGEYEACGQAGFDACHMTEAEIAKFGQMMAEALCGGKGGKKSCQKAGCTWLTAEENCVAEGDDTDGPTSSPMNECAELSGFTCRRRSQTCEWKNRKCVLKGDDMNSETMEGPTWEDDDSDCAWITKGFTCRRRFGCAWTNGQCVSKGQRRLPSEVELQAPIKA